MSGVGTAPPQLGSCASQQGARLVPFVSRYQSGNPKVPLTGPAATRPGFGAAVLLTNEPVGAATAIAPALRTMTAERPMALLRVRPLKRPERRCIAFLRSMNRENGLEL